MSLIKLLDFRVRGDRRGSLIALEQYEDIPFDIKRVYYIWGTLPGIARGFHAHKQVKQVAVCVSGSCRILMDDGKNKDYVTLNSPERGLIIDVMQWHEMDEFSEDCVLLVLASDIYEESDYIRDYQSFLNMVKS